MITRKPDLCDCYSVYDVNLHGLADTVVAHGGS